MSGFDPDDFSFTPYWEGDTVTITQFDAFNEYQAKHVNSTILATLKHVYRFEGASKLRVQMPGSEDAAAFLEANGFEITDHYERNDSMENDSMPNVIITGVYEYDNITQGE